MSRDSRGLDVAIMGRQFRIACPPGQEAELLRAVDYLDRKMREIRDSGKVVGVERIAVMVALNITYELLALQGSGGFDIEAYRRRIAAMEIAIDQALSRQDELF